MGNNLAEFDNREGQLKIKNKGVLGDSRYVKNSREGSNTKIRVTSKSTKILGKNDKKANKIKVSGTKLKCLYFNARSIINKREDLELYVFEESPDIIGITESWANEKIEDSELNLEGYTMLRKDRLSEVKLRGGGVLLYIKSSLNVVFRDELWDPLLPESIWCNIEIGGEKTLIGNCYRPPDSSTMEDEALYSLLCKISHEKLLMMGDFNFPELNWTKPETLDHSHQFIKCIDDNYLIQCVENKTRDKNVLDLVFISEENMIANLTVGEPFGTSDHQIIRWTFAASKEIIPNETIIKIYDYSKGDYDKIREEIENLNWGRVVSGKNVEEDWCNVKELLINMREKWVPIRKNKKGKCKWVTKAVVRSRRAKIKAWKRFQDHSTQNNLLKYKSKLTNARKACRSAKRNYENKLASDVKNNCKSFYAYVRSKQRTKDRVGPIINDQGTIVEDDGEAANLLNDYFSSVFTMENMNNIPEPIKFFQGIVTDEGLLSIHITSDLVERKLEKLKVDKCPGLDEIHPKLLYELRKQISGPLAKLFSNSLEYGVVPNDWKEAGVTPLFKKGKKSDRQNYRPVSLTSIVCKILESIIKDAMLMHLNKFSLIRDSQHGFTTGRSCLTNLLEFFEEVTFQIDESKPVDIIYLDFAKAFDKVPYQRLFKKLISHGVGGNILEWVKTWLTGRRQKVGINRCYSRWKDVLSGVPQGSVLGPLLFLIYINDLDYGIVSKLIKFADDTKVGRSVTDELEVENLRKDLGKIFQWSLDWQMLFNTDKCMVMHMGKNNREAEYKMGPSILKKSKREKDLGIIIENSGKTSEQCATAVKKANSVLGMIKRNITFKSKGVIVKLYKSLVRPRLEYCVQAWSPYLKKDIEAIERVQRRATKLIEGYHNMSYEDRLKKTGLISLEKRRVRGDLIQVFKILTGFDKIDYKLFFELVRGGKTRGHKLKLVKNRSNGNLRKNFFSQRIVNCWNSLPQEVVEADSINCFKNRLDKFDRYFNEDC
jgi:ribonucleases P/MRP protein subunit RPP40